MSSAELDRLVREPEPYAAPARLQARIALHDLGPADAEDLHRWLWRVEVRPDELPAERACWRWAAGRRGCGRRSPTSCRPVGA